MDNFEFDFFVAYSMFHDEQDEQEYEDDEE